VSVVMRLRLIVGFLLGLPLLLCLKPEAVAQAPEDYSGMYSFLHEGEFVQITIEDHGKVSGFVSLFDDSNGNRGAFLDQFFKTGKLEGNTLSFSTETVHGAWFSFDGIVDRGSGKKLEEEAYYVVRG